MKGNGKKRSKIKKGVAPDSSRVSPNRDWKTPSLWQVSFSRISPRPLSFHECVEASNA